MLNTKNILLLSALILTTTACNNRANNRLSATDACGASVNYVDPTAFTLTEKQAESFVSVAPADFPDEEALAVKSIISTFTVELENEERAIIQFGNTDVVRNPDNFSTLCINGLDPKSKASLFADFPIGNQNGEIQIKKFKIEIGSPLKEDKSDFLRITPVDEETNVEESSNTEEAAPIPFSDYFSSEGDQIAYYKLKPKEDETKTDEELLKEDFFIHYKNDVSRVRSRITIGRDLKKKP